MSAIDDPTIPDDLAAQLRSAAQSQNVSPAPLRSVQRRAGQRRRRRHRLVAGGAAAVVLLAGLVLARTVTHDDPQQVTTATEAQVPDAVGSVPQPFLLGGGPVEPPDDETGRQDHAGTWLDEITPTGAEHWWRSEPNSQAVRGVVLADGRRFGLAVGEDLKGIGARATIDEIGAEGRTTRSIVLAESGSGASTSIDLLGARGTELIIERMTETMGKPGPQGTPITTTTRVTALNVDTGAERTILDEPGRGASAAAGDRLVVAPDTTCTIEVRGLDGSGDPRSFPGGCPPGPNGLDGLADDLAISADGRYAAAVWILLTDGAPEYELTIVDLDTGALVHRVSVTPQWPVTRIGFTEARTLTIAVAPDTPAIPAQPGAIAIVTVPYAPD